jgi:N-carbamoyl-L-amino-acid hydrolase
VIGFAEEEGQRYKATFLGSGALIGHFNPAWLDQQDAGRHHHARGHAARRPVRGRHPQAASATRRDYLGFVEVHIEQGPVLNELNLPLGVVTSINGSVRYLCEVTGMASHAGTTPMDRRRDAAVRRGRAGAVRRAARGARRRFGGHHRHAARAQRLHQRGARPLPASAWTCAPPTTRSATHWPMTCWRNWRRSASSAACAHTLEETMRASAAPSDPAWQARWEAAVQALGVPVSTACPAAPATTP